MFIPFICDDLNDEIFRWFQMFFDVMFGGLVIILRRAIASPRQLTGQQKPITYLRPKMDYLFWINASEVNVTFPRMCNTLDKCHLLLNCFLDCHLYESACVRVYVHAHVCMCVCVCDCGCVCRASVCN